LIAYALGYDFLEICDALRLDTLAIRLKFFPLEDELRALTFLLRFAKFCLLIA
jgi:hypothetical protein